MPAQAKVLLSWQSPARPFKKRHRDYFTTIGAMVFLLAIILFFIKEWLLIGVILALTFVYYILSTIPPEQIEHQLTTKGIVTAGTTYPWDDLTEFYFLEKYQQTLLAISTKKRFPGRLLLLIDDKIKDNLKEILNKHLVYQKEPKSNFLDQAADWLGKKLPLERS